MLNHGDFAVCEDLVYLPEIREAGGALCVMLTLPPDYLSSLETGIEHIVVEYEAADSRTLWDMMCTTLRLLKINDQMPVQL